MPVDPDTRSLRSLLRGDGEGWSLRSLLRGDGEGWFLRSLLRGDGEGWSLRSLLRGDRMALLAIAVLGTLYPLTDPDLPMHLLVGEWIVKHRGFPTVEPFSWTRAGEPYYAYSWLPQVVFYGVWRVAGVFGLRVVYGLLLAGAAAAMMRLARMAEWPRGVTMVMVALHVAAFGIAVPSLRPQAVLFITLPLVWSAIYRLSTKPDCRRSLAVLFASSAVTAASHIFFPLALVPLMALWSGRASARTAVKAVAAILAGWLISPYALVWPRVFALNFAPNALLGPASPIAELAPGFSGSALLEMFFVMVISIGALWGVARAPLTVRVRVTAFVLLMAGIGGFAYATRLVVVFWILVAPVAGLVLTLWMHTEHRAKLMRTAGAVAMAFLITSVVHPRHLAAWISGGLSSRSVAWPVDEITAPVAEQLACAHFFPDTMRVFTRLRYANALAWQLRPYSMSIDSRTIFPDSVTRDELGAAASATSGVWRSADAVVVDGHDPLAAVLDTAAGWSRTGVFGDSAAPRAWTNLAGWKKGRLRNDCPIADTLRPTVGGHSL